MTLIEDSLMTRKYVCTSKSCNVRLTLNTKSGEVIQTATGIAALGALIGIGTSFLGGLFGDDSDNNS